MEAVTIREGGIDVRWGAKTLRESEQWAEVEPIPAVNAGYTVKAVFVAPAAVHWDVVKLPEYQPEDRPTKAEQEALRASAYRERVDPLTAEITRKESDLQREIVPPEDRVKVMARIDAAYAERDAAVADIDAQYPYPKE